MLNREKTGLDIFENFQKIQREKVDNKGFSLGGSPQTFTVLTQSSSDAKYDIMLGGIFGIRIKKNKLPSMFCNPIKFFKSVKKSFSKLNFEGVEHQLAYVQKLYEQAQKNHQVALIEKLDKEKERITKEVIMAQHGYEVFITEEDIMKFEKISTKSIKLDWIKNFTRVIPKNVCESLEDAETTLIFDNYVILHYDPKGIGSALTKKEKERKKDPILFGVMECSHRLYFIDDWIDEYCDLTLSTLLKELSLKEKDRTLTTNRIINQG